MNQQEDNLSEQFNKLNLMNKKKGSRYHILNYHSQLTKKWAAGLASFDPD